MHYNSFVHISMIPSFCRGNIEEGHGSGLNLQSEEKFQITSLLHMDSFFCHHNHVCMET